MGSDQVAQVFSRLCLVLKTFKNSYCTTSLGNLLHYLHVLTGKNIFLLSSLNLSYSNLYKFGKQALCHLFQIMIINKTDDKLDLPILHFLLASRRVWLTIHYLSKFFLYPPSLCVHQAHKVIIQYKDILRDSAKSSVKITVNYIHCISPHPEIQSLYPRKHSCWSGVIFSGSILVDCCHSMPSTCGEKYSPMRFPQCFSQGWWEVDQVAFHWVIILDFLENAQDMPCLSPQLFSCHLWTL